VPEHYERYGFVQNPFDRKELDPVERPIDMGSLVAIDGFGQLQSVEQYLQGRIGAFQPAFVVIEGGSDSGMSSAANAVLAKYRDIQGIPKDRFIALKMPLQPTFNNHLELDLYREWVLEFYDRATDTSLGLNLAGVLTNFQNIRPLSNATTWHYDLRGVLAQVQQGFVPPNEGFGTRFRQIKTVEVVNKAKVVFRAIRTVCVFTAVVGVLPVDFSSQNVDVHFWKLGTLTATEVETLVNSRWGTGSNLPFDPAKFGPFCAGRGVGAVLKAADGLLQSMARANPPINPWPDPNDTWPVDLRLDCRKITLPMLEALANGWK